MYSQVQVPISIHGNTIECAGKIYLVLLDKFGKLYSWLIMDHSRVGTCITCLTDSGTIKKWRYWLDIDTDTRIGIALQCIYDVSVTHNLCWGVRNFEFSSTSFWNFSLIP